MDIVVCELLLFILGFCIVNGCSDWIFVIVNNGCDVVQGYVMKIIEFLFVFYLVYLIVEVDYFGILIIIVDYGFCKGIEIV